MGRTKGTNPEEKFNDGREYQVSKVSSFQKNFLGASSRNMEPASNTAYTITRVSQDGVLPTGEIHYKREVVLFDSKEKWKAYNNLTDEQKGLGANGLGVTIATGSTLDGQKTFKLTEAGANISYVKNNEEDLGGWIMFRSGVELEYSINTSWKLYLGYDHRSSGDIWKYNPGMETIKISIGKTFL